MDFLGMPWKVEVERVKRIESNSYVVELERFSR